MRADPGELQQSWARATCRRAMKGSRATAEPAGPRGKWKWAGKEWSQGLQPERSSALGKRC